MLRTICSIYRFASIQAIYRGMDFCPYRPALVLYGAVAWSHVLWWNSWRWRNSLEDRKSVYVHIVVVCETVTTHAPTPSSLAKPASQRLSSRIQNKTKHPLLSRANDLVRVASLPVMKTASIFGSSFWSAVWVELCWPTANLSLKIWLQTRLEDGSSIEIEWLE